MKTVAVIGASRDRSKFGNQAVRAYQQQGYTVFPINLHEDAIEGLPTYGSVLDVPQSIDMATVYLPPRQAIAVVDEVVKKGITELWLNPGADGPAVVERARQLGLEPIVACSLMSIGGMTSVG